MTPTEISEHAKEAFDDARFGGKQVSELVAIQHGINLATAERDKEILMLASRLSDTQVEAAKEWKQSNQKDRRIAELEAERDMWRTLAKCYESKDREIERLKEEHSELEMHIRIGAQQLTEANAKLAEAEKNTDFWVARSGLLDKNADCEIDGLKYQLSSAQAEIKQMAFIHEESQVVFVRTKEQLQGAQAEIERLKVQLDIAFHPSHLTPTNETP